LSRQQIILTHSHSHEQTHSMCCLAPEKYLIYLICGFMIGCTHCLLSSWITAWPWWHFGSMHNIRDNKVWVMIEYDTCAVAVLLDTCFITGQYATAFLSEPLYLHV